MILIKYNNILHENNFQIPLVSLFHCSQHPSLFSYPGNERATKLLSKHSDQTQILNIMPEKSPDKHLREIEIVNELLKFDEPLQTEDDRQWSLSYTKTNHWRKLTNCEKTKSTDKNKETKDVHFDYRLLRLCVDFKTFTFIEDNSIYSSMKRRNYLRNHLKTYHGQQRIFCPGLPVIVPKPTKQPFRRRHLLIRKDRFKCIFPDINSANTNNEGNPGSSGSLNIRSIMHGFEYEDEWKCKRSDGGQIVLMPGQYKIRISLNRQENIENCSPTEKSSQFHWK